MTPVRSVAVVDDNEALNQTMSALIEHAGHRPRSFTTGEALLEEGGFLAACDCVLLDGQLRGMSGLDVLNRLQDGDEFAGDVVRDKKSMTLKGKVETTRSRRTYRSAT